MSGSPTFLCRVPLAVACARIVVTPGSVLTAQTTPGYVMSPLPSAGKLSPPTPLSVTQPANGWPSAPGQQSATAVAVMSHAPLAMVPLLTVTVYVALAPLVTVVLGTTCRSNDRLFDEHPAGLWWAKASPARNNEDTATTENKDIRKHLISVRTALIWITLPASTKSTHQEKAGTSQTGCPSSP